MPKMRFELISLSLTKRTQYQVMRLGPVPAAALCIVYYALCFLVGTNLANLPHIFLITPPLVFPPCG